MVKDRNSKGTVVTKMIKSSRLLTVEERFYYKMAVISQRREKDRNRLILNQSMTIVFVYEIIRNFLKARNVTPFEALVKR